MPRLPVRQRHLSAQLITLLLVSLIQWSTCKKSLSQPVTKMAANMSMYGEPYEPNTSLVDNLIADGLKENRRCAFSKNFYIDPYLGRYDHDKTKHCSAACARNIPEVTCCPPASPRDMDVRFLIYTPEDPEKGRNLTWDNIQTEPAPPGDKTVMMIHGFLENPATSFWMSRARDAYVQMGYTAILVDWRHGNQLNYYQSFTNVRTLSRMVGKVVVNWKNADRMLLLGFSLGGQTVGQAGRYVQENGGGTVARCHSIDPAGPFFTGCPELGVQRSDCGVLEVLHSSAEPVGNAGIPTLNFGTRTKSGHCDYWMNCGYAQSPACVNRKFSQKLINDMVYSTLSDTDKMALFLQVTCAHNRAMEVYMSQLENNCVYHARLCPGLRQGPGVPDGPADRHGLRDTVRLVHS
ncbi:Pancreatic triacylglycerol lipase [Halotydeus destructor]|nr:Pancreatic triacylglycerol lipase [Halotydeus destructor]